MVSLGLIMALLHKFPQSAATQAVTAAESAAESAELAAQHNMGVSVSGTTLVFATNESEGD